MSGSYLNKLEHLRLCQQSSQGELSFTNRNIRKEEAIVEQLPTHQFIQYRLQILQVLVFLVSGRKRTFWCVLSTVLH